jgi:hypothetical protein
MATIPHEPSHVVRERPSWSTQLLVPQMWATLAIVAIWLSVLFSAVYAGDLVTWTYLGDHTTLPSAVLIAPFAFLATWVVARNGYRRGTDRSD